MKTNKHPANDIAFLEKVFLRPLHQDAKLRGVELFNLGLVRDLSASGRRLFITAHPTWRATIAKAAGDNAASVTFMPIKSLGIPFLTFLRAAWSMARTVHAGGVFPFLFVANDAEGLSPAIAFLRRKRAFDSMVVFAHKLPGRRFTSVAADIPGSIACVCGPIAEAFRKAGVAADVHVDYGIVNADSFHPPAEPRAGAGAPMRVCLLGDMTSVWKGADTAIAAMELLPPSYRGRIELHIKAFRDNRTFPEGSGIVTHPWSGAEDIPDFLRGMDAMLALSRNRPSDGHLMETFSQTTVQGMLTGLPVVHTSIAPFAEKFDAGGGMLADTPEEVSAALVRLADDPELRARLGREARTTALARYVWDTGRFCRRYLS